MTKPMSICNECRHCVYDPSLPERDRYLCTSRGVLGAQEERGERDPITGRGPGRRKETLCWLHNLKGDCRHFAAIDAGEGGCYMTADRGLR